MNKIFLTYMTYKKRMSNGEINYATAAWHTRSRAEEIKKQMLERDDIDDVFIQELNMEEYKEKLAVHHITTACLNGQSTAPTC